MDAFSDFKFAAYGAKNILAVVIVMICPTMITSLKCLFSIKTTHVLIELYTNHNFFVLFLSHETIYATGKNILTEVVIVSKPSIDSSASLFQLKLLIYVLECFTIVRSLRFSLVAV